MLGKRREDRGGGTCDDLGGGGGGGEMGNLRLWISSSSYVQCLHRYPWAYKSYIASSRVAKYMYVEIPSRQRLISRVEIWGGGGGGRKHRSPWPPWPPWFLCLWKSYQFLVYSTRTLSVANHKASPCPLYYTLIIHGAQFTFSFADRRIKQIIGIPPSNTIIYEPIGTL